MKIKIITELLEKMFPAEISEDWDTTGLQVKPKTDEISSVVVALTLTEDVISKCKELESNLIICHHPMFFNDEDTKDLLNQKSTNLTKMLTTSGIGFYALHTNLDKKFMADALAGILGLKNLEKLHQESSLGVVGEMEEECSYLDLIKNTSLLIGLDSIRYSDVDLEQRIRKVAICPGSGRDILDRAIKDADAYLTGDLNFHTFEKAVYFKYPLVDISHYQSELIGMKLFSEELTGLLDIPVHFYPGKNFYKIFNRTGVADV